MSARSVKTWATSINNDIALGYLTPEEVRESAEGFLIEQHTTIDRLTAECERLREAMSTCSGDCRQALAESEGGE